MTTPSPGNDPGLPVEALYEIRNSIILALDATEDERPAYWQTAEARDCMRSALAVTEELLTGRAA